MRRLIILTFAFLLIVSMTKADDDHTIKIPDFPYQSPEASAFQRYGEYNVGEYTGNVQISIPLYTINCHDIQLPLNLAYLGGGIKVNEEATWVGLGWNLVYGGCITRIAAGQPDIHPRVLSWADEQTYLNAVTTPTSHCMTNSLNNPLPESLLGNIGLGLGEKDFFSLNLNGKMSYFMVNPGTEEVEFIGAHDDIYKVEMQNDVWIVTDCMGYTYTFSSLERAVSSVGLYISTWNISDITSPTGAYAQFCYSDENRLNFQPTIYQTKDVCAKTTAILLSPNGYSSPSYTPTGINTFWINDNYELYKRYLHLILTEEDSIMFYTSGRIDLYGAKKLDSLVVYSRITKERIREWDFNYDYFVANSLGNTYYEDHSETNTHRLKLTSVENGIRNTEKESYSFEYEELYGLPKKTSYSTDIWGYYNGTYNTHFIPSEFACFLGTEADSVFPSVVRDYEGANRFASTKYSSQYCLKKIVYPTKGYSLFSYEPHTFTSVPVYPDAQSVYALGQEFQCQDINYSGMGTGPTIIKDFTLNTQYRGKLRVIFHGNSSSAVTISDLKDANANVLLQQINTSSPINYNMNLSSVSYGETNSVFIYEMEQEVELPAGDYKFIANLPDVFGVNPNLSVWGILNIKPVITNPLNFCSVGGGVRIKSIKNYDYNDELQETTSYEYVNLEGLTSGRLLTPAHLGEYKEIYGFDISIDEINNDGKGCSQFQILRYHSSPYGVPAITKATCGGIVGYSRVLKKQKGRITELVFTNEPSLPDVNGEIVQKYMSRNLYYCNSLSNGDKVCECIVESTGDTLLRREYTYGNLSISNYKYNISVDDRYVGNYTNSYNISPICTELQFHIPQYIVNIYSFPYKWHAFRSVTEISYSNGIRTCIKTTNYNYDTTPSRKNHAVIEKIETTSVNGSSRTTHYEYPTMLSDAVSTAMVNLHMLNYTISESVEENSQPIWRKHVQYGYHRGTYLPIKTQYAPTGGALEDRIIYSYDNYCNPRYIVKDSVEKVCYLWAYNYLYPVAKIEGASYSDLLGYLTVNEIQSLATNTRTVDAALESIRTRLVGSGFLVTTYTYDSLKGITSQTLPNGATTTYTYDSQGRLSSVFDNNGDLIQSYHYNYKQ